MDEVRRLQQNERNLIDVNQRLAQEVERLRARVADFESGRVYEELQARINKLRMFKETVLRALESEYGPPGPEGIGPPWTDEIAALVREEV
jgi:archaellum component FlaC